MPVKVSQTSEVTLSFDTISDAQGNQTGTSEYLIVAGVLYDHDDSGTDLTTGDGRNWKISNKRTFANISALDIFPSLTAGDYVTVSDGYNSEREQFKLVAAATYTANSQEVYDLTASGLQAVSTRMWFKTVAHLIEDTRTHTAGDRLSVSGIGEYEATDSTGNLGQTNAGGQELDVLRSAEGYHVEAFGPNGDNTGDDSSVLTAAKAACVADSYAPLIGSKTYRLTATVDLRQIPLFMEDAEFRVDHAGIGIKIGGFGGQNISNPPQKIGLVYRDGTSGQPDVQVIGARGQEISIGYANYLQVYADGASTVDAVTAYSSFNLKRVDDIELHSVSGANSEYINSNSFFLNRSSSITVKGSYGHNHNIFYEGVFETSASFDFQVGHSNHVLHARLEGTTNSASFGADTFNCSIEQSWSSNRLSVYEQGALRAFSSITDNGVGNYIGFYADKFAIKTPIVQISPATCRSHSTDATTANVNPTTLKNVALETYGIDGLAVTQNRQIYTTGIIPVGVGVGLTANFSSQDFRVHCYAYDSNGDLMTDASYPSIGNYVSLSSDLNRNTSSSRWNSSTDVSRSTIVILDSTIAFLEMRLLCGATRVEGITGISVTAISFDRDLANAAAFGAQSPALPYSSSSPTKGFAKKGELVSNTGGGVYVCSKSIETTTVSAFSGADVDVASASGIAVNDICGVLLDNGDAHWTSVTAISGTTITLNSAPPSTASSGNRIVFNLWS